MGVLVKGIILKRFWVRRAANHGGYSVATFALAVRSQGTREDRRPKRGAQNPECIWVRPIDLCGRASWTRGGVRNTLPGVFSVMVNTTLIWVRVPEYPILP